MYKDMETGHDDDGALQEKLCALQLFKSVSYNTYTHLQNWYDRLSLICVPPPFFSRPDFI